jgi:hypothetical protein
MAPPFMGQFVRFVVVRMPPPGRWILVEVWRGGLTESGVKNERGRGRAGNVDRREAVKLEASKQSPNHLC